MQEKSTPIVLAPMAFLFAVFLALPGWAADTTFAGKYSDGKLTVELSPSSGALAGTFTLGGHQFPASAHSEGQRINGTFSAGNSSFPFDASLDGDTLTLASGGKTYTLKRLTPGDNPLANAPANPLVQAGSAPAGGDAPPGYTVEVSTDFGKSLVAQKANVATVQAALMATFPELEAYFGTRPDIGSAYQDAHDPNSGGATFSDTFKGQAVRGIVSCKLHDGGATIAVIFSRTDAPKAELQKLMTAPAQNGGSAGATAAPNAAAATPITDSSVPGLTLTPYVYPDGTGSVGVPEGWTATGQSAVHGVAIKGPGRQMLFIHNGVSIQTPDSPTVKMMERTAAMQAQNSARLSQMGYTPAPAKPLPPLLVAPLADPVDSVQALTPEFNKRAQFYSGPTNTFDRMISSKDLPCQLPNGKRAQVNYALTQSLDGQTTAMRVQADLTTAPVGNTAWMCFARYSALAPDATFDHDLPIMMAIVNSEKVDQQREQEVANAENQQMQQMGQQILDAGARQRQASFEQFQKDQQTRFDIHEQQQAQTQAGYDAHNQQFRDYEYQRSRNAADFNESIIGTRTIYDTVTGQSGYANLTDVNGVVDSLNQAALDPNRFVQIPLRDQLYPLPPGK